MKQLTLLYPILFLLLSCSNLALENESEVQKQAIVDFDLDKIRERGYLIAIMENSSTGLFIYKGKTMGYEYDLLKLFCKEHDLELRIQIINNLDEAFHKLNAGEGDVLAHNLTVTKERKEIIDFTHYHHLQRQVLVQRKPDNWRKMKLHEIEEALIRNQVALEGKKIHVKPNSAYELRLRNLSDEIGGEINIVEGPKEIEVEQLIRQVSEGKIEYTVAEEDLAIVNMKYYPNIDVSTPVSFPTKIAWGVRKNATQLKETINQWILKMRKQTDYYVIYDKYYKSTYSSLRRSRSEFMSLGNQRISPYDSLIQSAADELGWDWLLLAAQIFQESRFDSRVKSWAGAIGLMQVLPKTANEYGIRDLYAPAQNIEAGKNHLKWLQENLADKVDSTDLTKFILGAYNVGLGHIQDAMRLAKKHNRPSTKWFDVSEFLLKKSEKKYYTDPVVVYGYCNGSEPVNYVGSILEIHQNYLDILQINEPEISASPQD